MVLTPLVVLVMLELLGVVALLVMMTLLLGMELLGILELLGTMELLGILELLGVALVMLMLEGPPSDCVAVKPTGPVWEAVAVEAADTAEESAEAAAFGSPSVLSRTVSMMCTTPFGKRMSGWMIKAVMLPCVTYWPVELMEKEKFEPAWEVKFCEPVRRGEYNVVALIKWLNSTPLMADRLEMSPCSVVFTVSIAELFGENNVKP